VNPVRLERVEEIIRREVPDLPDGALFGIAEDDTPLGEAPGGMQVPIAPSLLLELWMPNPKFGQKNPDGTGRTPIQMHCFRRRIDAAWMTKWMKNPGTTDEMVHDYLLRLYRGLTRDAMTKWQNMLDLN